MMGWTPTGAGTDADAIHDNVSAEISAVTEKVTPVNADLVLIEDSAASNAKKRVQVGNLPTAGGGDLTEIASTTLGSDTATIKITGISASYKDLMVVCMLKTDRTSAASDNCHLRMGDGSIASGASDYGYAWSGTGSSDVGAKSNAAAQIVTGVIAGSITANPEADAFGSFQFEILEYASTTYQKIVMGRSAMVMPVNNVMYHSRVGGIYRSASAVVDQIELLPETGSNFKTDSKMVIYGRG